MLLLYDMSRCLWHVVIAEKSVQLTLVFDFTRWLVANVRKRSTVLQAACTVLVLWKQTLVVLARCEMESRGSCWAGLLPRCNIRTLTAEIDSAKNHQQLSINTAVLALQL